MNSFWENGLTNQKCQNFDLWPSRNNPSSDSTKSYLWYVVYVIPKKLHAKKRKKVIEQFLRKWSNKPKMSKFWPLTFKKQPFEWFNQILLMIYCLCHPKEASCKKIKKVIEQFLRKWSNKPKMSKFWPLTFKKQPFEWFNQILLMICCLCHPKEASCTVFEKINFKICPIWPHVNF